MLAFELAALICATLFTGAALYITLVEHPARLGLQDGALLAQWQPSYKRALPIQSGLAIAAGLAAISAWYGTGAWQWLAGSAVMLANWPFTLLVIMPINKPLMAMDYRSAGLESRSMLVKWGGLHNVRSALGLASVALMVWAFTVSN